MFLFHLIRVLLIALLSTHI